MSSTSLLKQHTTNVKPVLRRIRNYLAGQVVGLTRDESLLEEMLKCTFCRVHLERGGSANSVEALVDAEAIAKQYRHAFAEIRDKFPTLFSENEELLLAPNHIAYVDQQLATLRILETTHDIVGDIYETFIGSAYRGQEGQFFTPAVAVQSLVSLTEPGEDDLIVDPACGSGSFLLSAAKYIDITGGNVRRERIHGVDKDTYLVRLSQLHLAIQYDTLFPVNCADSLHWGGNGFEESETQELIGKFSLVLTNPPFGAKIIAVAEEDRHNFDLAYKWRFSKTTGRYDKKDQLLRNPAPQVLFVERCLSLVAPGGRIGMVLPESVLSNVKYRYVVQYMLDHAVPVAVIGMPEALFKTSGRGGTHTKVCLVVLEKREAQDNHQVFMAEAKWCGHDSRGRDIPNNDLPEIVDNYHTFRKGEQVESSHLGFAVPLKKIHDFVLAPRYYNPEPVLMMSRLEETHDIVTIGELVDRGYLSITTGHEVGKLAYGTGDVPFVRTSDISNWEVKIDPKHLVSEEVYSEYAEKQDVQEGDILMVRDGTYLIGTCAYITKYDTRIVYQSHLYKIRVLEGAPFDSYLLLALLSSPAIESQIQAMSFTQDIINSLGTRINDLILPIPRSPQRRRELSDMAKQAIESRAEGRELARRVRRAVLED